MSAPVLTRAATSNEQNVGAPRRQREPAIVQPGRSPRARSRVRAQWLALAAALVVLAGTLVAWALSRAADRVQVVGVAQPVQAGDVIEASDLRVAEVAIDADVSGLMPATSLDRLAGRVATIDLEPGMLVTSGMWASDSELLADERTIGAVLAAGRYPSGLAHGSSAWAIDVRAGATVTSDGAAVEDAAPIVVRVLDAEVDDSGALRVTLAVPQSAAVDLAGLAATDTLALAGVPEAVRP